MLQLFRQIQNQAFTFLPAQAGIRDGLSIAASADFLSPIHKIAFNHQSFDKLFNVVIQFAIMKDLLCDADLFQVLLSGV